MKLFIKLFIILFISINIYSSPFVKNRNNIYFEKSKFGYSNPSFIYLNIDETDYANFVPGYFWYKNWFASSLETTVMGNNLAPWKNGENNVDSFSFQILNLGYLFDYKYIDFFISIGDGLINIYDSSLIDENLAQKKKGTFNIFTTSLGVWFNWNFYSLKIILSGGTTGNIEGMSKFIFDTNYQLFDNWKFGLLVEAASRSFEICSDVEDDSCSFEYSLTQSSIYFSYNFYKNYWLLSGIVIGSEISKTINGKDYSEPKSVLIPFYISIE